MLQQKVISKILTQALDSSANSPSDAIYSVSLLSHKGLPLVTVAAPESHSSSISPENLRMYSLLATNLFKQQEKTGDAALDSWAALDLEPGLQAVIKTFVTSSGPGDPQHTFFVVIFYSDSYQDTLAKVRLDQLTDILASGMRGYKSL